MNKVLMVGDFKSNDGVANANKNFEAGFEQWVKSGQISYTYESGIINRIIEFIRLFFKVDVLCLCGISKINIIAIIFSKIFRKPIFYLMHGYPYYEQRVEQSLSKSKIVFIRIKEFLRIFLCNGIICVSDMFKEYMISQYPFFSKKFFCVYNPISIEKIYKPDNSIRLGSKIIVTTGGGRRIKNNLSLAYAIESLNNKYHLDFQLFIFGGDGPQSQELSMIPSVRLHEKVSQDTMLSFFSSAFLYVQNSEMETFGLAVIESLMSGCSILLSKNVGAIGVLHNVRASDIINNNKDVQEISKKILEIYNKGNNERMLAGLDTIAIDPVQCSVQLYKILTEWNDQELEI
ncbi:hypothetical protein HMPREF2758_06865 [Facklamia sp. HMSC062C11]|uniref:glycosyltransferase family 4 protein n=1 Tax=Facklamia sp. HMSC062C11 TaxID=1739262 RepID=UPI0008A448F3|nr:glycosyltransferase family 4 protein [Facklamia sp. HMSC062C11]OFL66858.1 hypothetical protein HMPREF2758_06865 [Facklamia sp. HMSC062C11]